MSSAGPSARAGRGSWALAMLATAGLYYVAAVGLVDPMLTVGRAAGPWPDGAEYLDSAVSLARGGAPTIHVAGEDHPSRFPIGYSLLVAAGVRLGVEAAAAPHQVNYVAGLGLLLLVAFWVRRQRGGLEAGLAALLLSTLPAFVVLCRSPLSEPSGALLAVGGLLLLSGYAGSGSTRAGGLGGLVLGASLWFRTSHALLFVFVPAALVARHGLDWRGARRDALTIGVGAAVGLVPLLTYNALTFGSPLATGYGHWVPYWSPEHAFQWQYVDDNLRYYWHEVTQGKARPTTASLYGQGSYLGPSFVLLGLLAPFAEPRPRRFWCFAAAGLAYAAAVLTYFHSDARLLFPLLVLAVPSVAASVVTFWRTRRVLASVVVIPLLLTALIGWPAVRGGEPAGIAFVRPRPAAAPSSAYRVTRQLLRLHEEKRRVVLTDLPPPYVHALAPAGTTVAPLFDDHHYRFSPGSFVFGREQRRNLVAAALAGGQSVWAATHRHDVLDLAHASPPPAGYAWEIVAREEAGTGGIARLVAN